jgi:hypothetical protein
MNNVRKQNPAKPAHGKQNPLISHFRKMYNNWSKRICQKLVKKNFPLHGTLTAVEHCILL